MITNARLSSLVHGWNWARPLSLRRVRGFVGAFGCAVMGIFAPEARTADVPAKAASVGLPVAELKRQTSIDFENEILPILRSNCLACHNTTKAKAGLNLETPRLIQKGGDNGPAVVPGKPAESLVFKAADHLDPDLIMPPKDNKANASDLSSDQLALLKLWIEQGAKGEVRGSTPVPWLDHPPTLDPILAVDLTADGQFAACSRGSRVDIYHVPSSQHAGSLIDPALVARGLPPAAHHDLVNALAFHPDGTRLVTAGYRDVKIWRRPFDVADQLLTNVAGHLVVSPDGQWFASTRPDDSIQLGRLNGQGDRKNLSGHTNRISALGFAPDQRHLASISIDGALRVWNIPEGSLAGSFDAPCPLLSLAWVDDGRAVALGGEDGRIRVVRLMALNAPRDWNAHAGPVSALAYSQTNSTLFSAGLDAVARSWDLTNDTPRQQWTQQVAIAAMAVRPDGLRLAAALTNGVVRLLHAGSGQQIAELKGDRFAAERVASTERSLLIARGDVTFRQKAVDTAQADLKKADERIAKAAETNTVTEKIFLEKEKAMRIANDARSNAEKGLTNLLAEIQRVTEAYEKADKQAHDATKRATEAAGRATETRLAADRAAASKADAEKLAVDTAAVADRTKAALANADAAKDTAKRIADESASVAERSRAFAEAVSADSEMKLKLATAAQLNSVKAIEEVAALSFAAGQLKPGYDKTVAEAPEKRKQATNLVQSTTKAFGEAEKEFQRAETRRSVTQHELELATGAGLRSSNVLGQARTSLDQVTSAQKSIESALQTARQRATDAELSTLCLAFSRDGNLLATLGSDRRVHTWTSEAGLPCDVLPKEPSPVTEPAAPIGLAFLGPDRLLAGTPSFHAAIWNLNPGWQLERKIGTGEADSIFADRVNAVRFSPDGRTLATGGGQPTRGGEIKLFSVEDGSLQRELSDVHSDAVLSLDFSPDGKHLASASADRFVKVVDLSSGKVVKSFEGHTSYVLGVAWKRDSRTLASAGADKVIKVWDFVTGDRRKNIEGADKDVTGVAFVGVTDQIVATSGDSQVRLLKESGEKVRAFEGAADFMNSAAATPDGRWVVAGGQDGQLHIWNGVDGRKVNTFAPEK